MQELSPLALLGFFGLSVGVPLAMLGVLLHRVRILKHNWRPVLAVGVFAFLVWVFLSFIMFYINFIFMFAMAHTSPKESRAVVPMLIWLAITIAYGLIGWLLCYWINVHRRHPFDEVGVHSTSAT